MVTVTQKIKNKFTKKVFTCPSCSKQLRVPIRRGKVLQVTCSRCKGQVQLSFKSPIGELLKWEKGRNLNYNLRMFSWRFKALPMPFKISLVVQTLVLCMLLEVGISWMLAAKTPVNRPLPKAVEAVRQI